MTNPSQSAEGQPGAEGGAEGAPPPLPPPPPRRRPDRSWIEFDTGIRNQDPGVVERKIIEPGE
ncbi:MAG TPA: hypothetical protein VME67_03760 [Mycobacterium sp.]|nr:hypothetical protein [Mycobacterium sp.]HTX94019.1 hypothetical protein [Mycobacterium sp.]